MPHGKIWKMNSYLIQEGPEVLQWLSQSIYLRDGFALGYLGGFALLRYDLTIALLVCSKNAKSDSVLTSLA